MKSNSDKTIPKILLWLRKNLFSSPFNIILSLILLTIISIVFYEFIRWLIIDATWVGTTKQDCAHSTGACWPFIKTKFRFFFFGFYPKQWIWRPVLFLTLIIIGVLFLFSPKNKKYRLQTFIAALVAMPLLMILIVRGWDSSFVSPSDWGGLLLTITLSLLGILFSFPLGILLALARMGKLKIVKIFATCIIEFFRGIPFITILFMASIVAPLFFPSQFVLSKLLRLTIGITLFEAAYLAEVIRGGLQDIPKGQIEASQSLGLPWWVYTYFVVLPQAIRVSLANITSISIAFIKDMSLVLIVGWFDLLGIVKPLSSDINWLGMEPEGYLFVGIIYWLLSFATSTIGKNLEKSEQSFISTNK